MVIKGRHFLLWLETPGIILKVSVMRVRDVRIMISLISLPETKTSKIGLGYPSAMLSHILYKVVTVLGKSILLFRSYF